VPAAKELAQALLLLLPLLCYVLPLMLVLVLLHVKSMREVCWG
jgi:hypothetical protein